MTHTAHSAVLILVGLAVRKQGGGFAVEAKDVAQKFPMPEGKRAGGGRKEARKATVKVAKVAINCAVGLLAGKNTWPSVTAK